MCPAKTVRVGLPVHRVCRLSRLLEWVLSPFLLLLVGLYGAVLLVAWSGVEGRAAHEHGLCSPQQQLWHSACLIAGLARKHTEQLRGCHAWLH